MKIEISLLNIVVVPLNIIPINKALKFTLTISSIGDYFELRMSQSSISKGINMDPFVKILDLNSKKSFGFPIQLDKCKLISLTYVGICISILILLDLLMVVTIHVMASINHI